MTVVAGVDVGNATTEVVVLRRHAGETSIVAAGRRPTRGRKGSTESVAGAASLVRRLESTAGCRVEACVVAPLRAVDTTTTTVPVSRPTTGRLRVVAAGTATPGGSGAGIGMPVRLDEIDRRRPAGDVVVLVPPGMPWRAAAERLRLLLAGGTSVAGVLLHGDDAVLVANRLSTDIPLVDQLDTESLDASALLAVEVREPGQPLRLLSDPVALAAGLRLESTEAVHAAALARMLADVSSAVVALDDTVSDRSDAFPAWATIGGEQRALSELVPTLSGLPPGAVTALRLSAASEPVEVGDLWAVDLTALAEEANQRRGLVASGDLVLAWLNNSRLVEPPAEQLSALLGRPVVTFASEARAAREGALTTPGAHPDALVLDIGAGTIDLVTPDLDVVAAGAGEMLTAVVSASLGLPKAAAEWVKRGPCVRLEAGQRYETEQGDRGFLAREAPPGANGMLAAWGPAGLLPFARGRSPAEWRALRWRIKEAVIGMNLRRALRSSRVRPDAPSQVLVVGGPAGDDELAGIVSRALPAACVVGKGNVAGTLNVAADVTGPHTAGLGHRYSAALGLALGWSAD